jgi:putative pyoverdin transport system ATP-binding/permease protein
MKLLQFLWRHSKSIALLAVFAGILSGLSSASLIALVHNALGYGSFPPRKLIMLYVLLCLLLLVTRVGSQVVLLRLSQETIFTLRLQMCANILSAPLRRLEEMGTARLFAALTTDATTISNALINVPLICICVTTISGCLLYIGWLSPFLLLTIVGFMALGILSYRLPTSRAFHLLRLAREESDLMFGHFRALIDGNKVLKLHRLRRAEFYQEDLSRSAETVKRYNLAGMTTYIAAEGWGKVLYFIYLGLLLFGLPLLIPIDGPTLTGYVLIILYIMGPIGSLVTLLPALGQSKVALQKLEDFGLTLSGGNAGSNGHDPEVDLQAMWERLELENVTHAYRHEQTDGDFILGPLSLTFRPGEVVFLTGGNGSGKSTFAKLLTGLYIPETGRIRLDGKSITDDNREAYRQLFSAVFSDFYLFERIRSANVPDVDALAQEYLSQLQLDRKVRIEKGLFSTTALSQGQRKRLALLTAYLDDRPFYVFDEWAADQDPFFKQIFYTQILRELKARNKAVLVISHDDRYYHVADRIIKMEFGRCLPT